MKPKCYHSFHLGNRRNINHGGVLNLVDGVVPDHAHLPPLGDENDVVALEEPHEPHQPEGGHVLGEAGADLLARALGPVAHVDHGEQVADLARVVDGLVVRHFQEFALVPVDF